MEGFYSLIGLLHSLEYFCRSFTKLNLYKYTSFSSAIIGTELNLICMKTKILMLLLGIVILFAGACKKGDMGPQGPKGDQGEVGEKGAQGIKGADGSVFLSGATVPAATLGKIGDFYFRTATGDLYGPKLAAGWGSPTRIKGDDGKDGVNGTNGTKILSGTAVPAAALGVVGDFYMNTAQMILYGPKTASGWGVGTNLKADARVLYSGWKTAVRYKDSIMDGTTMRIAHIYSPQLSETVIQSAAILVYLDYGGGAFPLPYTSRAGGRISTIAFKLKLRELVLYRFVHDGGALLPLSTGINYRFVIIPSNLYVSLKRRNIDFNNIEAVEQAMKEIQSEQE